MSCYYPRQAWKSKFLTKKGLRKAVFNQKDALCGGINSFFLPCSKCIGCRLNYSRNWAIRCMHEASLHESNSFITLTYSPENVPKNGSLDVEVLKKFLKRLRKRLSVNGIKIRFFAAGEYGSKFGRPHYHLCIFGYDFPDKYFFKMSNGIALYRSPLLEKCWKFGFSSVGTLTFDSASYVARYITKKAYGELAILRYAQIDYDTGEYTQVKPEFSTQSRKPGIAADWYEKWKKDLYPNDAVVFKGREMKPPRYYDGLYEAEFPGEFAKVKSKRQRAMLSGKKDNTAARLLVKEQCRLLKVKRLVRNVDLGVYNDL